MANAPHAPRVLLGRYRLGPELGRGAHGVVYLAEDLGRGGQHVALKLINETAGGAGFIQPAARILRWIRHPNWAEILDTGLATEGQWFEALRFVKGQSLAQLKGPQDPELVWRFLQDGARVLQALHRQDLIHYDVTPGNFLMEETESGPRFVLTDGGLAHKGPVLGVARGTPLFMAPEVTEDAGHDARVDLYSLGLVAFRLATGTDPFTGPPLEVLTQRRADTVPRASSVLSAIPPALDDVIASLLARRAGNRPDSGEALLRSIAEARAEKYVPLLEEEAAAASEGSGLIGRKKQVARFQRACDALAQALPSAKARSGRRTHVSMPDPVLLLHGPQGAGVTHLLRAMGDEARSREVPVLLLAGRDGAPDHGAPLQHLEAALRALKSPDEDNPAHRDRTPWAGRDRRERAYSKQRSIEHFLRLAREASATSPFVLAVEDYGELPRLARDAISALSRELLSRSEHGSRSEVLSICLAVDMGSAGYDSLLIPDSANREQPLAPVGALPDPELNELVTARIPDLVLTSEAVHTLAQVSDSLPGRLARMMGEGVKRSDIRPSENSWEWALDDIHDYKVGGQLPAAQVHALHQSTGPLRKLLEYLSRIESPLTEQVASTLVPEIIDRSLALAPLIVTRMQDTQRVYALASHAVRRAILDETPPNTLRQRSGELIRAMEDNPSAEISVDMARLHLELGEHCECLNTLARYASRIGAETRYLTQSLVRGAVRATSDVLSTAERRAQVSELLERGHDAVNVAQLLSARFVRDGSELGAVLRTAEVLEDANDSKAASALLRSQGKAVAGQAIDRANYSSEDRNWHSISDKRKTAGNSSARHASTCRATAEPGPLPPVLAAEYLIQLVSPISCAGRPSGHSMAARGRRRGPPCPDPGSCVHNILNNIGISTPRRSMRTAPGRLFNSLGDSSGTWGRKGRHLDHPQSRPPPPSRIPIRCRPSRSVLSGSNAHSATRSPDPSWGPASVGGGLDMSHRPTQALQILSGHGGLRALQGRLRSAETRGLGPPGGSSRPLGSLRSSAAGYGTRSSCSLMPLAELVRFTIW